MLKNQDSIKPSYPAHTSTQSSQYSVKTLNIKLHHLSRLMIALVLYKEEPSSIDILMGLTNYMSFPSQDTEKNMMVRNEIRVSMTKREDDSIGLGHSYSLFINGCVKKSDLDMIPSSYLGLTLGSFYNWFRTLESYIDSIEDINNRLKELRKNKSNLPLINCVSHFDNQKSNNVTKNTYRKRVKELKAERAAIERMIVKKVSGLFT